ncbi:spore coat protein YsxE (plasmid) [Bacillus sp. 31A1R]|uniref:Spore coat protein YsxE n=1 Tax=Robertmurraya mangrovi TaxID=3098077 RepID=A0ABU5IUL5_9BACI|nr:spore coat protein YsxE [Bacillus sp. 31A1R]MDZ5470791.1 spore coat protein YsxE [Bacillus sp. 31A1R]
MNTQNRLQQFAPILQNYSVQPHFIEDFGKVQRVYSDKGVFALKKIPIHQGTEFIKNVHFLYQKGFNRIVPIYPTIDGRYAVLDKKYLYYLMPWLPNEEKENRSKRHEQLFRELARLHTLSVSEVKINKEEKEQHYEESLHHLETQNEFIEGFIDECETRWYMSPFELLFCLYYNDIFQALKFSRNKMKDWYEQTKEDEKARAVIIHGKISTEHFLFDERGYGYFSNFENSRKGSPIHDLLPFLSRSLNTYPKKQEDYINWFYTYFKYFPLKDEEMLLFLSYLAHPGPILRTVEQYHKAEKKNERKFVQQLQRDYWLLKNTEYIVMRIEEIERQKKQAQAEAQAQAQAQAQNGAQS